MLYYGQLILFSNELGPTTPSQMLFVTFTLVLSLFFQIRVFGDISVILDAVSQEAQKWQ